MTAQVMPAHPNQRHRSAKEITVKTRFTVYSDHHPVHTSSFTTGQQVSASHNKQDELTASVLCQPVFSNRLNQAFKQGLAVSLTSETGERKTAISKHVPSRGLYFCTIQTSKATSKLASLVLFS